MVGGVVDGRAGHQDLLIVFFCPGPAAIARIIEQMGSGADIPGHPGLINIGVIAVVIRQLGVRPMARNYGIAVMALELMESLMLRKRPMLCPRRAVGATGRFRGRLRDPGAAACADYASATARAIHQVIHERVEKEDGPGADRPSGSRWIGASSVVSAPQLSPGLDHPTQEFELAQPTRAAFMLKSTAADVADEECDVDENVVP